MIYNFLKGSNYNKLNQKNNYLNKCISEKINHNQLIFKYEAFLTQKLRGQVQTSLLENNSVLAEPLPLSAALSRQPLFSSFM